MVNLDFQLVWYIDSSVCTAMSKGKVLVQQTSGQTGCISTTLHSQKYAQRLILPFKAAGVMSSTPDKQVWVSIYTWACETPSVGSGGTSRLLSGVRTALTP